MVIFPAKQYAKQNPFHKDKINWYYANREVCASYSM